MRKVITKKFPSLDSTNTWAKQHEKELDPGAMTCVLAEEQTKGRGRKQRTWISPKGNLYCTFCFRISHDNRQIPCLTHILSISLCEILSQWKMNPKIKWPNDVLIGGKKISGVLCDTEFYKNDVQIFLGIGININMEESILSHIDQPATSLKHCLGKTLSIEELFQQLLEQFQKNLILFEEKGFCIFQDRMQNLLAYRGQHIQIKEENETISGICHSITCDGHLNVQLDSKEMKTIYTGDVQFKIPD